MDDPNAIGPDGRVRLRCYLPQADTVWFSAGCDGLAGCGHVAPIGIRAAIRLMGPEATVRQLERRLRCSRCGSRRVSIVIQPDTRPQAVRESERARPETRAGLTD
jgi:DNA-directed RNA polymerase subunit RPC12/RpoP